MVLSSIGGSAHEGRTGVVNRLTKSTVLTVMSPRACRGHVWRKKSVDPREAATPKRPACNESPISTVLRMEMNQQYAQILLTSLYFRTLEMFRPL